MAALDLLQHLANMRALAAVTRPGIYAEAALGSADADVPVASLSARPHEAAIDLLQQSSALKQYVHCTAEVRQLDSQ